MFRSRTVAPAGSISSGEVVVVDSGGVDQDIIIGTNNNQFQEIVSTLDGQLIGEQNQSHDSSKHNGTFRNLIGSKNETFTPSNASGAEKITTGTDNHVLTGGANVLGPQLFGTDNKSLTANSSVTGKINPTTGARVDTAPTGGDATWSNPTNGTTLDGSLSTLTMAGNLTAARNFSDELWLTFPAIPGVPSGWTASQSELQITHRWQTLNPALDLTSTCTYSLIMRYTDGTEDTLKTLTAASADQGSLTTEIYDITTRLITQGKTPQRLMFRGVAAITIAQTGTTKSWNVDCGLIALAFSRNTIT